MLLGASRFPTLINRVCSEEQPSSFDVGVCQTSLSALMRGFVDWFLPGSSTGACR